MTAVNSIREQLNRLTLVVEILWCYGRARRALKENDARRAMAVARVGHKEAPASGALSVEAAAAVGRAVSGAFLRLPLHANCLTQSLVLTSMLARRSTPSTLVIGVCPGEQVRAHAWVEVHGQPLLPAGGNHWVRLAEL